MISALLLLVLVGGATTFWPRPITRVALDDGSVVLGEVTRTESYTPGPEELAALPEEARGRILRGEGRSRRRLFRTGNFDLAGDDFRWVPDHRVAKEERPADAWLVERAEWGPAVGFVRSLSEGEATVASGSEAVRSALPSRLAAISKLEREARRIERKELGALRREEERDRLAVRRAALDGGEESPLHLAAVAKAEAAAAAREAQVRVLSERIEALRMRAASTRIRMEDSAGRLIPEKPSVADRPLTLAQVVRAYPANRLTLLDRSRIYLSRWWEFLSAEPREANTEGGVLPAIFGTLMMTALMSLVVGPFGVIAALYLREYARQGPLVSAVRVAVGNLAGVPSIVFGVFGLGFFCYGLGGRIDALLYPERFPNPTFGTGGVLWASLTLALLTVPVVVVATEEALASVPRSLREGSYGCGASRWQTIRRIVLPHATPGILTGLILASARGAGEVAPLMITGVVKLAPDLPVDGVFPYFHLERSFMHLGFHIYDVGFQSRNSEAGKPMVFTTTLLLVALVAAMNLAAISLRSRLRRRFRSAHF
jgi:phosphate transport system permease protein